MHHPSKKENGGYANTPIGEQETWTVQTTGKTAWRKMSLKLRAQYGQ